MTLKVASTKGDLKVTVKDKDGKPIVGASVSSTTQPSGQQALSGTTGSDGTVTFSGVAPGATLCRRPRAGTCQLLRRAQPQRAAHQPSA